ncbi:NXPE family member 3 [Biomphalaria pfeifferi]|uniref:NXPE family member 3 n=1 Tax=Biomphalaria pfeifferi TaxID=112525 RepID=A0AAD8F304_BIOPF|nr:NXPE family member 3 [Biomphalaria pfeifferi]
MFKDSFTNRNKTFLIGVFIILSCCILRYFEMIAIRLVNFKDVIGEWSTHQEGNITQDVTRTSTNEAKEEENETLWPSLRDTNITKEEVIMKLNRSKTIAVRDVANCASVYSNLRQVWRSHTNLSVDTRGEDFLRIDLTSKCGAFHQEELMRPSPWPLLPLEQDYLASPHVNTTQDIASGSNSKIELMTPLGLNNTLTLGSEVKFKITLLNARKELRTVGGDQLNVRLISPDFKAAITADVIDNRNGTYTAVTRVPWTGHVKVVALIAHYRETFRMTLYRQRVFKSHHWFVGNFLNDKVGEATPCLPFPHLPAHSSDELCNLTEVNGAPWYCGKPVKADFLNCSHFVTTRRLSDISTIPLSDTEAEIHKTPRSVIPNDLVLSVIPDETSNETVVPSPKQKCEEINLSLTFDYNNSFGDSNARAQYDSLSKIVKCQEKMGRNAAVWHAPLLCEQENNNISISYLPHTFPFVGSLGQELPKHHVFSETRLLDSIPNEGKFIIYFHHFMHINSFHLSVLENRLQMIREAVKRLLDRNRHVIFLYQSAHYVSVFDSYEYTRHGKFFAEFQRRILRGLGERVMFVNVWPMTIAVDNNDVHPPIFADYTKLYTGHICGRL